MAASFAQLFKKYRLKSEMATLSDLGDSLAEKGFLYEDSIFSHWQKGTRIPQNRALLLELIEIFIEKNAITFLDQANEFLSSAHQGYLSEEELEKLSLKKSSVVFQTPSEIANFSGREDIIKRLTVKENIKGKVILIHGAAGMGKTVLAIKLSHLLRDRYKDGVLWYKIEADNIMDILLSIAHIFGEDLSNIHDLQVRATIARSLLASKSVLLIFDSGELYENIHLLLPNSSLSTTIITTQKSQFKNPVQFIDIKLSNFTDKEVLSLFKEVLKDKYPKGSTENMLKIARRVGNLPLAVHILSRELLHRKVGIVQIPTLLNKEIAFSYDPYNEDRNLYKTISLSYKKLNSETRSVLLSTSIFKGKDFSLQSIAYINGLPNGHTQKILEALIDLSLVEHSTKSRFRIHPIIKNFARDKLDYPRSAYLSIIATLIFIFFVGLWIYIQLFLDKQDKMYLVFSGTYSFMALYGAICGLHTSYNWGGFKTLMGKAIFIFSLGLISQVFGQLIYSYYTNIQHIQVPYPSIGDIGYFGTIPLYIYGALLLAKSSGIKVNFKSFRKKIFALVIPLTILSLSYILFLQDYKFDFGNPVKIFLDFGYPLGESIYISIAIIIFIFSRNVLDGIMRSKALLILIALLFQFLADYIFLYNSSEFYSGSYIDLIYLVSYFTMTVALLSLKSIQIKVKSAYAS